MKTRTFHSRVGGGGLLLLLCGPLQAASVIQFSATSYEVTEGTSAVEIAHNNQYSRPEQLEYWVREDDGAVRIGVIRGDDGSLPSTVEYTTKSDTAEAGQDFVQTAGILEFAPGEKVKYFSIPIINDLLPETNEIFYVVLSNPKGMSLPWERGAEVRIIILDNDSYPGVQFEFGNYSVLESEGQLALKVYRSNDADRGPFTVDYATTDGTALAGEDYTETKGTLMFGQDELVKVLRIPITKDQVPEDDKEFSVTLRNPTGAGILGKNASAIVKIIDPQLGAEMVRRVEQSDLVALMKQITGEEPVLVGNDVSALTNRSNASGSPLEKATRFGFEQLQALGLNVSYQHWETTADQLLVLGTAFTNRNVIAVQPGSTRSNEIVVIGAHVDDEPEEGWAPGADGNATGSAAVLEAARVLSQYQFARTLHFVLFTGEERGCLGSSRYVDEARAGRSNIVMALVLDMLGHPTFAKECVVYVSGFAQPKPSEASEVQTGLLFTELASTYELSLRARVGPVNILANSDSGAFWEAGFPAVWVFDEGYGGFGSASIGNASIHSTSDTLATLDLDYFTDMVRAIVGTAAQLARPLGNAPFSILEVANSDWTLGTGIGGGIFHAKFKPGATATDNDPQDHAWSVPTNSNSQSLTVFTEPYGVRLQTDSRPPDSETVFRAKLVALDPGGTGLSGSSRPRFTFLTPPEPSRIYLARIHVDGRYTAGATDFDCITNLQQVVTGGGFIELPNLKIAPNGAVYGTCDIAARFLNTEPANYRLRITGVGARSVVLAATAQLGAHIIDALEVSTNLASGSDWMLVKYYTNNVSPDAAYFDAGWTEIARDVDPSQLPAAGAQFFRLKRTWIHY